MTFAGPDETDHCIFTFIAPRLLVQRFKPTARFTPDILDAVAADRDRIIGKVPVALLVCIPPEVPVEAESTNTDHFLGERAERRIAALALVAESNVMRGVCKFYFTWFPQPFPAQVFAAEADALDWLNGQPGWDR